MKKIVSVVLMLMCMLTMHAQLFITPEAGMTASKIHWQNNWNAGWKAGVGLEYRFRPGAFSLKSGAYYMQQGFDAHIYTELNVKESTLQNMYSHSNSHRLQIPLQAKFGWKLSESVGMHVAAGPYVAISLANTGYGTMDYINYGRSTNDYYYLSPNQGVYGYNYGYGYGGYSSTMGGHNTWSGFKDKTEWGAALSIGVEINRLSINLNYDAALGKGRRNDFGITNHAISLTIGYAFRLTK